MATLREILQCLEETYCRTIGVEYTHIEDPEQRDWLRERMESTRNRLSLDEDEQLRILTKLTDAEIFEQFIQRSYGAGTKRFSLEGAESLIPLLDLLVEQSAAARRRGDRPRHGPPRPPQRPRQHHGQERARDLRRRSRTPIPSASSAAATSSTTSATPPIRSPRPGKNVHLTLTFNPSHLEFVNPVVEGRVRAKQERLRLALDAAPAHLPDHQTPARRRVLPLLIHGDAAFMGQGIVAETLNLTGLHGYTTGGTVHVIVNNQIGFTTDPEDSRSTRYASDITRMLKVPVFHVNGEDPEAVAQVAHLAVEWRQRFGMDVVIDMYCYRRHGHNEGDEPRYTQPLMYQAIDRKPTVRQVYVQRLLKMGHVTEEQRRRHRRRPGARPSPPRSTT